ncbi:hypothetical protein [Marinigracilibium pacificum]|uniref:Lipoprotein n=1 Tax=Marinigracilibium pacificum TaxID=2729599 RepID=A0A848IZU3_9BACT|nr:hypothetical protein [Marinigracilibium pacificum]NMM50063.1 hypothetical protein [Marinigracilibium pacificum]
MKHTEILKFGFLLFLLASCSFSRQHNGERDLLDIRFEPDTAHYFNSNILNLKQEVLAKYNSINNFYKIINNGITYVFTREEWKMSGKGFKVKESEIIDYIKEEMASDIEKSSQLTNKFKSNLKERISILDHPASFAELMMEDSVGSTLFLLKPKNSISYHEYYSRFTDSTTYRLEGEFIVPVSDEGVQKALLELTWIIDENSARILIPYSMLGEEMRYYYKKYFLFFYEKQDGQWLLDDVKSVDYKPEINLE